MALTPAPKVLSTLVITNATGSILPIGAGVRLQPGQTMTVPLTAVQDIQQMMPRLRRLAAAGKILSNYREIPGLNGDVAGQPHVLHVVCATVTQNVTRFILPNETESATETLTTIATRAGTVRNLFVKLGTAPSSGQQVAITMFVNGVASAVTCTISGTGTTASDVVHTASVKAGDTISFSQTSSVTSAAANISLSCEIA